MAEMSKFSYKVLKFSCSNGLTYFVTFQFSNLCGAVYKQGNVEFTADGNSVLSPVGNRISLFDLKKQAEILARPYI